MYSLQPQHQQNKQRYVSILIHLKGQVVIFIFFTIYPKFCFLLNTNNFPSWLKNRKLVLANFDSNSLLTKRNVIFNILFSHYYYVWRSYKKVFPGSWLACFLRNDSRTEIGSYHVCSYSRRKPIKPFSSNTYYFAFSP